jgi:hypothetical protein
MTPADFVRLDRDARLNVLREVQHHFGLSEEYFKLARMHEFLLSRANGQETRHRRI